jgi:hypothetical protein
MMECCQYWSMGSTIWAKYFGERNVLTAKYFRGFLARDARFLGGALGLRGLGLRGLRALLGGRWYGPFQVEFRLRMRHLRFAML